MPRAFGVRYENGPAGNIWQGRFGNEVSEKRRTATHSLDE